MHRLAQNKGASLGDTGTVGSGFWEINKGYPLNVSVACMFPKYFRSQLMSSS